MSPSRARVETTASPTSVASFPVTEHAQVSIVLVTFGTGTLVVSCLQRLASATDGLDAEVIVVDNHHPRRGNATADLVTISTAGVRLVISPDNLGFGGGVARGVAQATGELLCLLNPDVEVVPGQLPALVRRVAGARRLVVPGFVLPDGAVLERGVRLLRNGETRFITDADAHLHRPHYGSAACWMLRRVDFDRLGGFDDAFHPAYYEDVDFALRFVADGGEIVIADEIEMVHHHQGSTSEAPDVERQRAIFVERWADLLADCPTS